MSIWYDKTVDGIKGGRGIKELEKWGYPSADWIHGVGAGREISRLIYFAQETGK